MRRPRGVTILSITWNPMIGHFHPSTEKWGSLDRWNDRFLEDLPPNHLPWIISSSQEVQWLAHIGDPASGTHMSSTEFIFAVQQRLRVQLFDQEYCSPPGQEGRTSLSTRLGFTVWAVRVAEVPFIAMNSFRKLFFMNASKLL